MGGAKAKETDLSRLTGASYPINVMVIMRGDVCPQRLLSHLLLPPYPISFAVSLNLSSFQTKNLFSFPNPPSQLGRGHWEIEQLLWAKCRYLLLIPG